MNETIKDSLDKVKQIDEGQFKVLYRISKALNSASLKRSLFEETLDIIIDAIDAERALFAMYDDGAYKIVAARNINQESITDLSQFSSGILQRVMDQKKPVIYHDVQSDPNLSSLNSVLLHNIKSVLGVPILKNDKLAGVIIADSTMNRREFNEENLLFLDFFSSLVSLALEKITLVEALLSENRELKSKLGSVYKIPEIVGESPAIVTLKDMLGKVAKTNTTVLLLGESGTGKELAARAIHQLSSRVGNPFIAQFCGSISDSLLESELFGYKKGAFTGANNDKKGLLEASSSGSFFLDEIGDISSSLQAKLLRVLQNKEIIRVGDTSPIKLDTRIIAATNRDLQAMVKEGKFREDLFYRLNVFPIILPPLRDRKGDVPLLVQHFVKQYFERPVSVDRSAMEKLEKYSWPGNVRQLENVIQRAAVLCDEDTLLPEHIIIEDAGENNSFHGTLEDFERMLMLRRLKEFNGNRTQAAKSLGVSVRWIQLKLKEIEGGNE